MLEILYLFCLLINLQENMVVEEIKVSVFHKPWAIFSNNNPDTVKSYEVNSYVLFRRVGSLAQHLPLLLGAFQFGPSQDGMPSL